MTNHFVFEKEMFLFFYYFLFCVLITIIKLLHHCVKEYRNKIRKAWKVSIINIIKIWLCFLVQEWNGCLKISEPRLFFIVYYYPDAKTIFISTKQKVFMKAILVECECEYSEIITLNSYDMNKREKIMWKLYVVVGKNSNSVIRLCIYYTTIYVKARKINENISICILPYTHIEYKLYRWKQKLPFLSIEMYAHDVYIKQKI